MADPEPAPPARPRPGAAPLIEGDKKDEGKTTREYYTKYEYRIPMRDGVRLFTAVYVPKDHSRNYPILFNRTPYSVGPYGVDAYPNGIAPNVHLYKSGYIFVKQDVRGRFQSEGDFVDVRPFIAHKTSPKDIDESSDAYDTIDWLVKNVPANNGKVGRVGHPYPGFYAAMAAMDAHPAVKAVSPQAPVTDWFIGDDFHHNGALWLPHAFNFYSVFGKPRPEPTKKWPESFDYGTTDGYDFFMRLGPLPNADKKFFKGQIAFWEDLMRHPNMDDFWKARNPRPFMKNVKPAVMTVGGWFDAEDLFGALETYRSIETQGRGDNTIVMGPWRHGGWARTDGDALGPVSFGQNTSRFYQEKIETAFFEEHLKGVAAHIPEAWMFETGTNEWRTYDVWPPAAAKKTDSLSPTARQARVVFADGQRRGRSRRVPQRSGAAGALSREAVGEDGGRVHGGGPALRRASHRRADLRDRAPR